MTKKRKIFLPILLVAAVAVGIAAISASGLAPEPYVDSWEAVQAMSEEEVLAIVRIVATCEQGELPDHAFAACVRAQDIDPELAEAAFDNITRISAPAVAPGERSSPGGSEPERFGAYVRDGNGGYYEYDQKDF